MWQAADLAAQLRGLGLGKGDTVLAHTSLREVGPMRGGASALVRAFRDVLGDRGALVVPTFTQENSRTSRAHRKLIEGLDPAAVAAFEAAMPAFDPAATPAGTGAFAEYVRRLPDAVRSTHPQTSYAAIGGPAASIVGDHALDCHHGRRSPLGRIEELGGYSLLIGVGYRACSAFHAAEYRVAAPRHRDYEAVVGTDGGAQWQRFRSVVLDDGDFEAVGKALDDVPGLVRHGRIGFAPCRLFPVAASVDFAVLWFDGRGERSGS